MNTIKGRTGAEARHGTYLAAPERRQKRSAQASPRFLLALLLVIALPLSLLAATNGPQWWRDSGAIDAAATANDYAAINQGQLKNLAVKANAHLHAKLPTNVWSTTEGVALTTLINSFQTNSAYNYNAVNLGQLKAVAKPFYDVLKRTDIAYAANYPWTGSATPANDYAIANIGQAKNLFAFDLNQFFPDSVKQQIVDANTSDNITAVEQVLPGADFDNDGVSNIEEYRAGGDPTNYYSRGADTIVPVLEIISGNSQTGTEGTFSAQPLLVKVTSNLSPLAHAPVTFTVGGSYARLSYLATAGAQLHSQVTLYTDASGIARLDQNEQTQSLYYQFSSNTSEIQEVTVSAGTALPVAFTFSTSTQQQADFIVDQLGSTDYQSIQSALDAVTQDDQIIEVKPGYYWEALNFPGYKVTLRSQSGASNTIIDAFGSSTTLKVYADTFIEGFTITGGNAEDWNVGERSGGGVCVYSGSTKLVNCIIRDNASPYSGSAIYSLGSATCLNCTIFNNKARDGSSALQTEGGTIALTNTIAWDSTNEIGLDAVSGECTVTAQYSDISGKVDFPGLGNLRIDPLLGIDGHIYTHSPCIQAGIRLDEVKSDMDGEVRPAIGSYDIGADQYVDSNQGGLPDWWQLKYYGHLGVYPQEQSPTLNGFNNLQNFDLGIIPTISTDPAILHIVVVSGDDQTGVCSRFLNRPFIAKVYDQNNQPVANARVTFQTSEIGGKLSATNVGVPLLSSRTTLQSDEYGRVLAWFYTPSTSGTSKISITCDTATAAIINVTTLGASSISLVPLNGLALWLSAEYGVTTDDSGNVVSWSDMSNSYNDAYAVDMLPRLVEQSDSGKPAVKFSVENEGATNRSSVLLVTESSSLKPQNQITIISLAREDRVKDYCLVSKKIDPWNETIFSYYLGKEGKGYKGSISIDDNQNQVYAQVSESGGRSFKITSIIYDGSVQTLFQNGIAIASSAVDGNIQYNNEEDQSIGNSIAIGGSPMFYREESGSGYYVNDELGFSGDISEVLIYNRSLSLEEINQAEVYLADKYGVYHPNATWWLSYGESERNLIQSKQWSKKQIDAFLAQSTANPETPADGLILWLKGDAGIECDVDGQVVRWNDQSAFRFDAYSAYYWNQPKLSAAAINGKPAVRFDGNYKYLTAGNWEELNPKTGLTVIAVMRPDNNCQGGVISKAESQVSWSTNGNMSVNVQDVAYFLGASPGGLSVWSISNDIAPWYGVADLFQSAAPYEHSAQISSMVFDGSIRSYFSDGNLIISNNFSGPLNDNQADVLIGAAHVGIYGRNYWDPSSPSYFNGDIAEILVYNRSLSDAERQAIENTLIEKYGLYREGALWIGAYSSEVQAEINLHHWCKDQAEGYIALRNNNPNLPIQGLELWLRTDMGLILDPENPVLVREWKDQSPNGNNAIPSQSNVPPQSVCPDNLNGASAVEFDITPLKVPNRNLLNPEQITIIAVSQYRNANPLDPDWEMLDPDIESHWSFVRKGDSYGVSEINSIPVNGWVGNLSQKATGGYFYDHAPAVLTFTFDGQNAAFYVDDVLTNTKSNLSPIPSSLDELLLGGGLRRGYMSEVLIYRRQLSEAERRSVGLYLANKYGLFQANAEWINGYPDDIKTLIRFHKWSKKATEDYLAWMTAQNNLPIPSSGLRLWLRADIGVTIGFTEEYGSTGNSVATWHDQSFNHNDAFPAHTKYYYDPNLGYYDGTSRTWNWPKPILVQNAINGQPAIRFSGYDQSLYVEDKNSLRPKNITIITVARSNQSSASGQMISKPYTKGTWTTPHATYQLAASANNEPLFTEIASYGAANQLTGELPLTSAPHIITAMYDGQTQQLLVDGAISAISPMIGDLFYDTLPVNLAIGVRTADFAGEMFKGDIAEILIYDHALTDQEMWTVNNYLSQKYSIPVLPSPIIQTESGDYLGSVDVSVLNTGEIHYTLDGTTPTLESPLYTGPIHLTKTTQLNVRSFFSGGLGSQTVSAVYYVDDPLHNGWTSAVNFGDRAAEGRNTPNPVNADLEGDVSALFTPSDPSDPPQIVILRPTNVQTEN